MSGIDFYYVDKSFINILQRAETEKRGFTRIPNFDYENNSEPKFVVGCVLKIGNFKYFAPISHYKKQKPNNILIYIPKDKIQSIKGSIRFNYMFPILDKYISKLEISKVSNNKYRRLIQKELKFCIDHKDEIYKIALKTYLEVMLQVDKELINNACDFQLLEETLKETSVIK